MDLSDAGSSAVELQGELKKACSRIWTSWMKPRCASVGQLAAELQESRKWETLRQHDLWRRAEESVARKYNNLLQLKRQQLEGEMARKILQHRAECEQHTRHELNIAS